MDCSKTEVFLRELKRMCKENNCHSCPLGGRQICGVFFPSAKSDVLFELCQIVQKWSDEHPQETILEHFKKILPNMCCENKGVPNACMRNFDSRLFIEDVCIATKCTDCWNRPYEEAIRGSKE